MVSKKFETTPLFERIPVSADFFEKLYNTSGELLPISLDQLKAQVISEQQIIDNWIETAEPLLWTADTMILPMFCEFMQYNKSIIRFSKIFDQDPGYYLSAMKEKFPLWNNLYFSADSEESDKTEKFSIESYLNKYKAFAVHFSDRAKDQEQLKKFYRKQLSFLDSLDKKSIEAKNTIIYDQILHYLIIILGPERSLKLGPKLCVGLLSYLLYHGLSVQMGEKETNPFFKVVFDEYMTTTFSLPPTPFASMPSEKALDRITRIYMDDCTDSTPGQIYYIISHSCTGKTPYVLSVIKRSCQKLSEEKTDQKQIERHKAICMDAAQEADCKINTIRTLVFERLEKEATEKKPVSNLSEAEEKKIEFNQDVAFMKADLDEKDHDLEQARGKISNLQSILSHQKEEIRCLKDKIKQLESDKQALMVSVDNMEELLSHIEDEGVNSELSEEDFARIKRSKVIVVGGHDRVHQLLLEKCPSIRTIDADPGQIDVNLIRNADVICFLPHHLSHATFDNVKKIAGTYGVPQVYQTSNNIRFILNTILSGLKK